MKKLKSKQLLDGIYDFLKRFYNWLNKLNDFLEKLIFPCLNYQNTLAFNCLLFKIKILITSSLFVLYMKHRCACTGAISSHDRTNQGWM